MIGKRILSVPVGWFSWEHVWDYKKKLFFRAGSKTVLSDVGRKGLYCVIQAQVLFIIVTKVYILVAQSLCDMSAYLIPALHQYPFRHLMLFLFCQSMFSVVCFSQVRCFALVLKLELRPDFSDLSSSSFHLWGVDSPSGTGFPLLVRTLPLLYFYTLVSFYIKNQNVTLFYLGFGGFCPIVLNCIFCTLPFFYWNAETRKDFVEESFCTGKRWETQTLD